MLDFFSTNKSLNFIQYVAMYEHVETRKKLYNKMKINKIKMK